MKHSRSEPQRSRTATQTVRPVAGSSLGRVTVVCSEKGLREVRLQPAPLNGRHDRQRSAGIPAAPAPLPNDAAARFARQSLAELAEYWDGRRRQFTVPLDLEGTPFQMQVWKELLRIPYGETRSYGEIARAIGRPKAARAVGMANHWNPVAIIVPCHRVVAGDGSLGGYAGGLKMKSRLLRLESSANGASKNGRQ